jgi:hypothetical protein
MGHPQTVGADAGVQALVNALHSEGMARYRWRTALRKRLPWFLVNLGIASKGRHDCGAHDWYQASGAEDRCYHCEVGVRHPSQL